MKLQQTDKHHHCHCVPAGQPQPHSTAAQCAADRASTAAMMYDRNFPPMQLTMADMDRISQEQGQFGKLRNYATGEFIRNATRQEEQDSNDAAEKDGGVGAFAGPNGVTCYVEA